MDDDRYAIVGGNGRSGSNWILQLLDASPETHCRSEPIDLESSPFKEIRPHLYNFLPGDVDIVVNRWSNLISWGSSHAGVRDHPITVQKNHIHSFAIWLGLGQIPYRPTARQACALVMPRFQSDEFVLPWWIWRGKRVQEALLVLKFHLLAHHAEPILSANNGARFIHNIRHPGGYINSLLNRFYNKLDYKQQEKWTRQTVDQLSRLVEKDDLRLNLVPNFTHLSHFEAALWLWRFTNEDLINQCSIKGNYKLVVFEDAILNPISSAQELYQFCDLGWSKKIENRLYKKLSWSIFDGQLKKPENRSHLWKEQLEASLIPTVEKILDGSVLCSLWS